MITQAEMQRKLITVFQIELDEHVKTLTRGLLALEESPEMEGLQPLLAELFRAAHSLKGAARGVGVGDVEAIAHKLEDILRAIQSQVLLPTPELIDDILPALDAIRQALQAFLRDETLPPAQLATLLQRLETSLTQPASKGAPPQTKTAPTMTGDNAPLPVARNRQRPSEMIRVDIVRLNKAFDALGELLVAQRHFAGLLAEIQSIQSQVDSWQKEWRQVRGHYNRLVRSGQNEKESDVQKLLDFLTSNENSLKTLQSQLNLLARDEADSLNQLTQVSDELQDNIHRMRMRPVADLLDAYPRMVRDLAREQGKQIKLEIAGADTHIDRNILEMLRDPLTHLLRNAVDHGIETPEQRQASGKSALGNIKLKASQQGNTIQIEVIDDGAGIDLEAVRTKAVELGLMTREAVAVLDVVQSLDLIFASGLTTAKRVSEISGRGVGMDIVRQNLEQLRGLIGVDSVPGHGSSFKLTLPLTLTTGHVLLIESAGETLALPTTNIERILFIDPAQVKNVEGSPALYAGDRLLPLIHLDQILGLPQAESHHQSGENIAVIILGVVEKKIALIVDGFKEDQDAVIKKLGHPLSRIRNFAGAVILGDGQVVLVLNVTDLIKSIQVKPMVELAPRTQLHQARRKRILVVDDSITTRTLEKNILEIAGFQVYVAADGREALALVEHESLDAVVADIAMPHMDGIALTQAIKQSEKTRDLPVVLVTSLDSPADKIRGMQAGADAYLTKKAFDQQDLLETIERLIG